jgi:UDP-GlcNAc:undecaprenyl-phosphate GlcNAc-1-phosphate transferase
MIGPILLLCVISFLLSWILTYVVKRVADSVGFVDKPGGRKIHANPKPLGGGIAIFWAVVLPMLAGLAAANFLQPPAGRHPELARYWSGIRQQTPLALALLIATLALHVIGLIDDRKPLGPYVKLAVQLAVTAALVVPFNSLRALTAIDNLLHTGGALPIILSILWITAVTNAFNFLDNMDGLSAGVAAISSIAFLATTLTMPSPQWFVAAVLAALVGALAGFLCFNFAPASIFMGDSGSLTIGFLLGVLTVRTQYLRPGETLAAGWYAVFAPIIVLAVPLYDLLVVSALRISRGKSPFVGDTNHFSHRLVARGMSRRTAVLCLYLITATTSLAAILLPHVHSTLAAVLIFTQTLLILGVVMLLEQHPLPGQT